jgi:ribonucleoside-diphosphate reductase alpha chain
MKFIMDEARKESAALGKQRGSYPALGETKKPVRNATLLTITPTGGLAFVAGATSGIEPLTPVISVSDIGSKTLDINPIFEKLLRERGAYSAALALKVLKVGADTAEVPRDLRGLFVTATDIPVETHLRMQAAFQKNVDNGVGKALHLSPAMKPADVRKLVLLGQKLRLKGIWFHAEPSEIPCRGCGV